MLFFYRLSRARGSRAAYVQSALHFSPPSHALRSLRDIRLNGNGLSSWARPNGSATTERNKDDDQLTAASDRLVLRNLLTHIWPANDRATKARVLAAMGLLLGGKVNDMRQVQDDISFPF